jgi:hypothetical protein
MRVPKSSDLHKLLNVHYKTQGVSFVPKAKPQKAKDKRVITPIKHLKFILL